MKIFPCSDVHTEFYSDGGWPGFFKHLHYEDFDVLVLAGDILNLRDLTHAKLVFDRILKKTKVIYVPGNHEFWGTNVHPGMSWDDVIYPLMEQYQDRFYPLRTGKTVVLDGVRFHGDTMWFPDTPEAQAKIRSFSDNKQISGYSRYPFEANAIWNKWAKHDIRKGDVVVTHHAPSYLSCAKMYRGNEFNCFYFDGGMESVIMKKQPKLWIHGHVHSSHDYQIGDTRIVCNPLGVPPQQTGFNASLIIEV